MSEEIVITDKKLSEIKPYDNKFRLKFRVVEKEEEREVKNRNNPEESHRISNITVADDTASIILTAWDSDIDQLSEDKTYMLENGFCNLFNDSMRLVRGKFGEFTEIDEEIEIDISNNRSEEKHQRRTRNPPYRQNTGNFRSNNDTSNLNYGNFSSPDYGRRGRY